MSRKTPSVRSALTHITPSDQLPWWWDDIRLDRHLCELDYIRLKFRGKRSKQITLIELPIFLLKLLKDVLAMRRKYDYVFTVECDFTGFGIALWQSLLFMKRPRHVILQFIMREKTARLSSRLKYALMSFMFRSVHRVICSSRAEAEYYRQVFAWERQKVAFVPLLTSPRCLEEPDPEADENYFVAAGRVFRDYPTAIAAVRGTPHKMIIVGAAGVTQHVSADEQVQVLEEISQEHFMQLVRRATAVVIPLVDKKISTGQTVLLQTMAMGKLVIATRTAGTEDYVDHMIDGLLVSPGNVEEMRCAMSAASDPELRRRLGASARARMAQRHMPHHYSAGVRRAATQVD
jgi:glycosyltransferase involved in cell wall biosynthesis